MVNFIARDYYDAINAEAMQTLAQAYQGSPMYDQMISMARWMTNPIVLIFAGVIEMVCKGGVLGLVLAAFFKKNPDPFAYAGPAPSCPAKDE
jgi:hypothetical protein